MSTQTIGFLIGGLVPALMFGVGNIAMKESTSLGIALPTYLIIVGTAVIATGVLATIFISPKFPTLAQSGTAIFNYCWRNICFDSVGNKRNKINAEIK